MKEKAAVKRAVRVKLMKGAGSKKEHVHGADFAWEGGRANFVVEWDFDLTKDDMPSVRLQMKLPAGGYEEMGALSAPGAIFNLELPTGEYRAVSSKATSVHASLHDVLHYSPARNITRAQKFKTPGRIRKLKGKI